MGREGIGAEYIKGKRIHYINGCAFLFCRQLEPEIEAEGYHQRQLVYPLKCRPVEVENVFAAVHIRGTEIQLED